jgi:hypothetical protein
MRMAANGFAVAYVYGRSTEAEAIENWDRQRATAV